MFIPIVYIDFMMALHLEPVYPDKVSVTICEQNRKTIAGTAAQMFPIRFPKHINDVQNVKVKDNVTLLSESRELSPYISFTYTCIISFMIP